METTRNNTKMTGYLEKKGKNKMIGAYKKYWFVLEGGLLLYYRSKIDYDTISPFKGSINLGPPCTIKPLISTAGAFQIQTRTAIITLRAPNQEEQNRWMQAIMSEINPTKNPQKMSHFRYSLKQFPATKEDTEPSTNRAVSLEEPLAAEHLNDSIIQRLQKIGGQSYGNSVTNTISKAATRRAETKQLPREFVHKSSDDLRNSEITETSTDSRSAENIYEQIPSALPESNHRDKHGTKKFQKSLSLTRMMPNTFRVEPNHDLPIKFVAENDASKCIIQKETVFFFNENKQTCKTNETEIGALPVRNEFGESTTETDRKPTASNETIETHISVNNNEQSRSNKKKNLTEISSSTDNSGFLNNNKHSLNSNEIRVLEYSQEKQKAAAATKSDSNAKAHENILMENDLYGHALKYRETNKTPTRNNTFFSNKTHKYLCNIEEQEERSISLANADENKRSTLIQENEIYSLATNTSDHCSIRNDLYSLPVKEKKTNIDDGATFCIDNDQYADSIYCEVNATTDYNENDVSEKNSQENLYSIPDNHEIKDEKETVNEAEYAEPQYIEGSKSKSKLSFLIKKKAKKETDIEVNKNNSKLKKRNSFIRRVWKKKVKPKEKAVDEFIEENLYDTVAELVIEKLAVTDGNTLKMLSELQNILEMKKPVLIEKISDTVNSPTSLVGPENISETSEDNRSPQLNSVAKQNEPSDQALPILTPKTQKLENPSPFHDIPKNNKPVVLPPKKTKLYENIDDIDEILDELNNQNNNRNKVKSLIKRFSETDVFDSDVELRTNRSTRELIDSDELSRLLAELAEVTNAPILTPGATSSLNGSNIGNVEFSKLLPERRRRHSEPDYDIPRPHKSLTMLPKKEEDADNVIESTRFFGPILKPCDMAVPCNKASSEALFRLSSITPDSLEGNIPQRTPTPLNSNDDYCESHQYYEFMDRKTFLKNQNRTKSPKDWSANSINSDMMIENDIYVDPKSIRFNFKREDAKTHSYEQGIGEDEVFIDSLENDNGGNPESTAL
ncbi:uncharacterized protein [Leptinotarsa decemlineata]|uniref:uncharacterized protein n=1 Tax=Leptinotarsa decemlineata TaxID=7539 RepID=UPI003D306131